MPVEREKMMKLRNRKLQEKTCWRERMESEQKCKGQPFIKTKAAFCIVTREEAELYTEPSRQLDCTGRKWDYQHRTPAIFLQ